MRRALGCVLAEVQARRDILIFVQSVPLGHGGRQQIGGFMSKLRHFLRHAVLGCALVLSLASAGSAHAQSVAEAAAAYARGDFRAAESGYRIAAERGDADGQAALGWLYARGQGVPQDQAEALRWYRLAAEQGHAGAQRNMGNAY